MYIHATIHIGARAYILHAIILLPLAYRNCCCLVFEVAPRQMQFDLNKKLKDKSRLPPQRDATHNYWRRQRAPIRDKGPHTYIHVYGYMYIVCILIMWLHRWCLLCLTLEPSHAGSRVYSAVRIYLHIGIPWEGRERKWFTPPVFYRKQRELKKVYTRRRELYTNKVQERESNVHTYICMYIICMYIIPSRHIHTYMDIHLSNFLDFTVIHIPKCCCCRRLSISVAAETDLLLLFPKSLKYLLYYSLLAVVY